MSLLAGLAPHLPYVRRYARALTGDQAAGDAYVRAALEALAAGEGELGDSGPPRVALYRIFHLVWGSAGAKLEWREPELAAKPESPSRRLLRLAPRSRQA